MSLREQLAGLDLTRREVYWWQDGVYVSATIGEMLAEARAEEREACAKIADAEAKFVAVGSGWLSSVRISQRIRARKEAQQ